MFSWLWRRLPLSWRLVLLEGAEDAAREPSEEDVAAFTLMRVRCAKEAALEDEDYQAAALFRTRERMLEERLSRGLMREGF